MGWKTWAYKALKYHGDVNAVRKGRIVRRVARRGYGKATGRAARRLFR